MNKRPIITTILPATCMLLLTAGMLLLTGCGHPKIVGVKSLTAANVAAQSKVENYHIDGTINMEIELDYEELQALSEFVEPKLPVEVTIAADAGTETAHVTTKAGVSVFGKSVDVQKGDYYVDMKQGYQDQQLSLKEIAGGLAIVGKTVLDSAAFAETDEAYSLTMPAEKAGDLIADMHLLDCVDLGIADIRDVTVEGGQIVYNVDKETLLIQSIQLQDVNVRGKGVYEDSSVSLKSPINASFQFSRYNELDEKDYAIPEEK